MLSVCAGGLAPFGVTRKGTKNFFLYGLRPPVSIRALSSAHVLLAAAPTAAFPPMVAGAAAAPDAKAERGGCFMTFEQVVLLLSLLGGAIYVTFQITWTISNGKKK